jgi:hypothetical protein
MVSTDAAGNVKNITRFFTVFGAVPTPTPTPTAKPTPRPTPSPTCPTKLTGGTILATLVPGTADTYDVSWKSTGGCAPFSGSITGKNCYFTAFSRVPVCDKPFWTLAIRTQTGRVQNTPPCSPNSNGNSWAVYTLTLRDAFGQLTGPVSYGSSTTTGDCPIL